MLLNPLSPPNREPLNLHTVLLLWTSSSRSHLLAEAVFSSPLPCHQAAPQGSASPLAEEAAQRSSPSRSTQAEH